MNEKEVGKFLHDLRAPLARAITYSKLAEESPSDENLWKQMQSALQELDAQLKMAEEKNSR